MRLSECTYETSASRPLWLSAAALEHRGDRDGGYVGLPHSLAALSVSRTRVTSHGASSTGQLVLSSSSMARWSSMTSSHISPHAAAA